MNRYITQGAFIALGCRLDDDRIWQPPAKEESYKPRKEVKETPVKGALCDYWYNKMVLRYSKQ